MKQFTTITVAMVMTAGLLLTAGCAPNASEQFAKVEPGMSHREVSAVLGQPELVTKVRFSGHPEDFEIWQYEMVPDVPSCPTDMAIAALTLGISRLARVDLEPSPHWVYFQNGRMVHTSRAFDCDRNSEVCQVTGRYTKTAR
jgi:hypothetical protein